MSALSPQTLRESPPGSVIVRQVTFDCAHYEQIEAAEGPFRASYGQHAIVVSPSAPMGDIQYNGRRVSLQQTSGPVYSLFQRNDHVSGYFQSGATYEIVLLCPNYVADFLRTEFSAENVHLAPATRVEMPPLSQLLWRRLQSAVQQPDGAGDSLFRVCLELFLTKLVEPQLGVSSPAAAGARLDAVNTAIAFIDANIGERIDIRAVADAAGLSPNYFCRLFERSCGATVHRFVLDRRLQKARTLLTETQLPISQIAMDLGFSSQSHLTTSFRQRFGVTPAQCRNGHPANGLDTSSENDNSAVNSGS